MLFQERSELDFFFGKHSYANTRSSPKSILFMNYYPIEID